MRLTERLESKISDILDRFQPDSKDSLLWGVLQAAALYWVGLDEDDFCVQLASGDGGLLFGGINRLAWSPAYGFSPDRLYCTERFLANYDSLGPLPLRKVVS